MGLEGSLTDFRITEIIQLIGQQYKTGVLHVHSRRRTVEVFFLEGLIVHVMANYRSRGDLLGEILLKAGKISQEQLIKVLKLQDETLQYTGELMVELKMLDEEEIVRVISTQVYETVYDLLTWRDGSFRFELRAVESYKRISVALSPEHVLLNVLRMMDEWPEIEESISSLHVVFRKTRPLPKNGENVTPEQHLVYELVDGKLTLQEITDRSLLGRFNACQAIVELWDKGYVERASLRKPALSWMMGTQVGLGFLSRLSTILAYAIMLVVGVFLVISLKGGMLSKKRIGQASFSLPETFLSGISTRTIQKALTLYYLENGQYPESLPDLVHVGLVSPRDLALSDGASFNYQRVDGGYVLTP
jgi:hypothetical protein